MKEYNVKRHYEMQYEEYYWKTRIDIADGLERGMSETEESSE